MQLVVDEAVLQRAVGAETLARGRRYARDGSVLSAEWDPSGKRVVGRVRGTARRPYSAIAILDPSPEGRLRSFRGTCTCPVGANCKHSVALVLARPDRADEPAPWERRLRAVTAPQPPPAAAQVGLQFELTEQRGFNAARLALRPVLPGRSRGWVRTGITWTSLHYWYGREPLPEPQLRVLRQILALGTVGASYETRSHAIDLTRAASRRVWDLLADAAELGIPLITSGAGETGVLVHRTPVEFGLDADRDASGLTLRPMLAGSGVVASGCVPLGDPAHGVAWRAEQLHVAPLVGELDAARRELLCGGPLRIPTVDAGRFFAEFYPALRRSVPVTSSTVELPEPAPPELVLTVHHRNAGEVRLQWRWSYRLGPDARTEPLYSASGTGERDASAETAALESVVGVLGPLDDAFEQLPDRRLAAEATLRALAAVRFAAVLPELARLPDVRIVEIGTSVAYRELAGPAQIAFADAGQSVDGDWFDLAVTVSVGGHELPFEQLFVALATEQTHLILDDGHYLVLDRAELAGLARLIAESRELHDAPPRSVRVGRLQASVWGELAELGELSGPAAGWQRTVRALTEVADLPAVQPSGLVATLRPYQLDGMRWLAFLHQHRLGGILADDMGLGKTLQVLALIAHVRDAEPACAPFLIVAPTSVMSNWVAECERFAPGLRVRMVSETQVRRRGTPLAEVIAGADVIVTSYTLFRLEFDDYERLPWAALVLDEAQAAKNAQSRNYRCAKLLPAPVKIAITGTPMENHLGELWSLLSITAPGLFPIAARFDEHYRRPIERARNADRLAALRTQLAPVVLRRTKDEVAADLPDKQEQVLEVELTPRHRRAYDRLLHRERQKVLSLLDDLAGNRFEIFRSLTLLRQASLDIGLVDPASSVPSTKLDVLTELLGGIVADGHRVLVFSQFTRFLASVRVRLADAGIEHCYLDGTTRNRPAVIGAFKSGAAPVFLISLKAGGVGLNLTEADYCVLLDPWWNPAVEAQAVDRAHRIGQTNKVMVYRLVAKQTLEEKVVALKERKAALFADVLGGGEFAETRITAADIRAMLA